MKNKTRELPTEFLLMDHAASRAEAIVNKIEAGKFSRITIDDLAFIKRLGTNWEILINAYLLVCDKSEAELIFKEAQK